MENCWASARKISGRTLVCVIDLRERATSLANEIDVRNEQTDEAILTYDMSDAAIKNAEFAGPSKPMVMKM
jgi:hypothetical protein